MNKERKERISTNLHRILNMALLIPNKFLDYIVYAEPSDNFLMGFEEIYVFLEFDIYGELRPIADRNYSGYRDLLDEYVSVWKNKPADNSNGELIHIKKTKFYEEELWDYGYYDESDRTKFFHAIGVMKQNYQLESGNRICY